MTNYKERLTKRISELCCTEIVKTYEVGKSAGVIKINNKGRISQDCFEPTQIQLDMIERKAFDIADDINHTVRDRFMGLPELENSVDGMLERIGDEKYNVYLNSLTLPIVMKLDGIEKVFSEDGTMFKYKNIKFKDFVGDNVNVESVNIFAVKDFYCSLFIEGEDNIYLIDENMILIDNSLNEKESFKVKINLKEYGLVK